MRGHTGRVDGEKDGNEAVYVCFMYEILKLKKKKKKVDLRRLTNYLK